MNLIWLNPPRAVQEAAQGVSDFTPGVDYRWAGLSPSAAPSRWVERVFWTDIQSLIDGRPLREAAKPGGWRFLSTDENHLPAAAYVSDTGGPAPPRLTSVLHGPRLAIYLDSLQQIDRIAAAHPAPDHCVLRVLTIPCLLIEAYWMVPETGGDGAADWIVPFRSMVPGLAEMKVLTAAEFVSICKPNARKQLALHPNDTYGPPQG